MKNAALVPLERIQKHILLLRGQKVMLSEHLAELYGVAVKVLNQAVKRNRETFPEDFMFQLDQVEFENLKSQFVTSSWGGARRALPYAFTEQGVAMLSGVLRSHRAVQVNIAVMRAFVELRQLLGSQTELGRKLSELERRIEGHDTAIRSLFGAIRQLMAPPAGPPKPEIGFHVKEDSVPYRIRLVVADSGGMRPDALVKTLPTVCSLIPGTFEYLSYSDNGPDTTFSQENGYKDYMGSHAVSKRKVTRAIIWRRKICCP